jgi:hypothetical protein
MRTLDLTANSMAALNAQADAQRALLAQLPGAVYAKQLEEVRSREGRAVPAPGPAPIPIHSRVRVATRVVRDGSWLRPTGT